MNIHGARTVSAALTGTMIFASLQSAAEFQGAEQILEQLSAEPSEDSKEESASERWVAEAKAFRLAAATLPPADAASRWLERLDEMIQVRRADRSL